MNDETIEQLENTLGYQFSDRSLLMQALTHASKANSRLESNERMEFFGDAILDLVICQALYEQFEEYLEGDLTKIKSMMVSRKTCALVAGTLGLDESLQVGPGMATSAALSGSLAAGALEAVIAAIYIDGGLENARKFILRLFESLIKNADAEAHQENYKSLLQQHAQQVLNSTVYYDLLDEKGPDHNKCFEAAASVDHKKYPSAWGTNKKEAQQKAAYNALVELGVLKKAADEDCSQND